MDRVPFQQIAFALAPSGWRDALLKGVIFIAMIVMVNGVVEWLVTGLPPDPVEDGLVAALVGLPFVVGTMALVAYQVRLGLRLIELATNDMLTGLPNRRSFFERSAESEGVVLMMDLDHFKRINDTYGHGVGDLCLKTIARNLKETTRAEDVLGRLGGEEFAALLVGVSPEDAREVGERLARGVVVAAREAGAGVDADLTVTASIGAVVRVRGESIEQALARADRALYAAKSTGRARLSFAEVGGGAACA